MAAVGRADEIIAVEANVYDNTGKEITPEMVRTVLGVLIESNFNLVDDIMKGLKYDLGITLEQKFNQAGALASGTINIGNATSQSIGTNFSVTGFASATVAAVTSGADQLINVVFSTQLNTNNYMPVVAVRSNSPNHEVDNDLVVHTFKAPTINGFQISIRKLAAVTTNVQFYVKIYGM